MASLIGRALLAVTERRAVRRLFTELGPGRAVARRFVAGETLDEAVGVAREVQRAGMSVSLDHLGEHVTDPDMARGAKIDYLECLERIGAEGLEANISVKLTQLGLGIGDDLVEEALDQLGKQAASTGTTVTIDMEESRWTQATVDLFERAQRRHGNFGVALQAYLHRTPADLERLLFLGGHIRLCKGAYAEPAQVAYQGKGEVSRAFRLLLRRLMAAEGTVPAVATHDEALIDLARELAAGREAPFEFQMLYGVRPRLQRELVAQGHPLRIYLPYGAEWYPYLTRRLAERPSNLAFFLRALLSRS